MRIGDDLKRALSNPEGQSDIFERLNRYEKMWRSMMNLNNKFMPGYDKTEHVTYATTFNTNAITNEQTIVNNTQYVYNGTYWLTSQVYQWGSGLLAQSANFEAETQRLDTTTDGIIAQDLLLTTRVVTTNDGSNYWNYSGSFIHGHGGSDNFVAATTASDSVNVWTNHDVDLSNTFYDFNSQTNSWFRMNCTKVGSPGDLDLYFTFVFRYVDS